MRQKRKSHQKQKTDDIEKQIYSNGEYVFLDFVYACNILKNIISI